MSVLTKKSEIHKYNKEPLKNNKKEREGNNIPAVLRLTLPLLFLAQSSEGSSPKAYAVPAET
jgi:hypothetical protein